MKRKMLLWLLGAIVFTAASVNVGMNLLRNTPERDLMLANVEALAQDEQNPFCSGSGGIDINIVNNIEPYDGGYWCAFFVVSALTGKDPEDIADAYYADPRSDNKSGAVTVDDFDSWWFSENCSVVGDANNTVCSVITSLFTYGVVARNSSHVILLYQVDSVSDKWIEYSCVDTMDDEQAWYAQYRVSYEEFRYLMDGYTSFKMCSSKV